MSRIAIHTYMSVKANPNILFLSFRVIRLRQLEISIYMPSFPALYICLKVQSWKSLLSKSIKNGIVWEISVRYIAVLTVNLKSARRSALANLSNCLQCPYARYCCLKVCRKRSNVDELDNWTIRDKSPGTSV